LEESLMEDDLEHFRVVVEALTEEFDLMDVAMAAVKLAHEASGAAADEDEIPEASPFPSQRADRGPESAGTSKPRRERAGSTGMTRIYVGAGRAAGIRPKDLVGAIAGESRVTGREIGAIEIADRFSLVEVPDAAVDEVIEALRGTTIKGKRPTVRRERY
jgi:ATP-dependent RNA helicase DeaD